MKKTTLFLIGDSTMADKENPEINPECGWGQMLPHFFNDNIKIENHAVNGRSTKSFINEERWDAVRNKIKKSDYVMIQFGHNDQKDQDPERFTNPNTGYYYNLKTFIEDTRSKEATPVLISSIVRRKFNDNGVLLDTHGIYPIVMRQLANELSVPFIDLQTLTENLVLKYGIEKSKELYLWLQPGECDLFPDGIEDNTHFSKKGAMEIAQLSVEMIKKMDLALKKYLK